AASATLFRGTSWPTRRKTVQHSPQTSRTRPPPLAATRRRSIRSFAKPSSTCNRWRAKRSRPAGRSCLSSSATSVTRDLPVHPGFAAIHVDRCLSLLGRLDHEVAVVIRGQPIFLWPRRLIAPLDSTQSHETEPKTCAGEEAHDASGKLPLLAVVFTGVEFERN